VDTIQAQGKLGHIECRNDRRGTVGELISIIVATYNREDALDAVLRALTAQSDSRFEVIVADDGSGPATAQVVKSWVSNFRQLIHVRHEDRGFRLAEIRNRAILGSTGDICVFLDGDCLARPDFVAAHRRLAQAGRFVVGNRVLLSRDFTDRILRDRLEPENWGLRVWMMARSRGEINRLAPLLRLPVGPLRHLGRENWRNARGGNLAIRREDLIRVDGFDGAYSGWGREDSDIVVRLMRAGVGRKDGRFATGVLHLWHPENDRYRLADNERLLSELMRSDRIRSLVGLSAVTPSQTDPSLG
jgi:glycosyltransferase involved in cell wall biosynthesis